VSFAIPESGIRLSYLMHFLLRSHTQEKPYQCPIEGCKRFFSRSDNLTQHRRTHERNGRTQRLTLANLQQCGSGTGKQENPEKVKEVQTV
jgi:hypothetical protein